MKQNVKIFTLYLEIFNNKSFFKKKLYFGLKIQQNI